MWTVGVAGRHGQYKNTLFVAIVAFVDSKHTETFIFYQVILLITCIDT